MFIADLCDEFKIVPVLVKLPWWIWIYNSHESTVNFPDSIVHGANMGPIWGWQDPGGPHVGPMNFAI